MTKIYSTKWALTKGVLELELTPDVVLVAGRGQFVYPRPGGQHRMGINAFLTKLAAEQEAKRLATSKIVSLKKQILKLQELEKTPKHGKL